MVEGGNDFLDGGAGSDSLLGGSGDDILVFDANDILIDGGAGNDTVQVEGNFDFSILNNLLSNVEIIDLENGSKLTVDNEFLSNVSGENYAMQIDGDNTSEVTFDEAVTDSGTETISGHDYTIYTINDTIIHINTDITVVTP